MAMSQHQFAFAGVEGFNRETCWLMIQDTPVQFIDEFLTAHAPVEATQKFIMPDSGGGMHGSPQKLKVFKKHCCKVQPTAPDASNQNPVEQCHQTISNAVRAMLIGADLPIKFWPCCLSLAVQIFNSPPSKGQTASPIEITTHQKEDWTRPKTFGCRVWV